MAARKGDESDGYGTVFSLAEVSRWFPGLRRAPRQQEHPVEETWGPRPLTTLAVHAAYEDFVWDSLQRLGIRKEADLEDLHQQVFVTVHKRLHSFDCSGSMRGWLYGICKNVALGHRRRAYLRHEMSRTCLPDVSSEGAYPDPEESASTHQARAKLEEILDDLDADKRALLVMFEIDGLCCDEIARLLGIPCGTVYSRLHNARKAFEKALSRSNARDARRGSP